MEGSLGIFDNTLYTLEKVMDLRSLKHNLIISNIANMDTPNYKAFDLLIEDNLDIVHGQGKHISLKKTEPGHLDVRRNLSGETMFRAVASPQATIRGDGNTVDISKAMGDLAENTLMYNAAAQIISKKFQVLKYVIDEGK